MDVLSTTALVPERRVGWAPPASSRALVAPNVGARDRSTMAQAQRAVAGRSGAAARQKGETRCADAEAKTMDVFHFHVRASPCHGLLAFLWAIGLLYLQLTYMGLGPLDVEGPVPPHSSNP